jgi:hypothetical protein
LYASIGAVYGERQKKMWEWKLRMMVSRTTANARLYYGKVHYFVVC